MITDREPTPEERANRYRRAIMYVRISGALAILNGGLGILALARHTYTELWIPYVNIGVSLCWILILWREWNRARRENLGS
ncbi:MAG TPA: hypothetical protein VFO29_11490 [Candidatus Rubrimentiphilum sp.]|nr:hypothetical protein [Candidatus Rubrimentiphilum sp.]